MARKRIIKGFWIFDNYDSMDKIGRYSIKFIAANYILNKNLKG